MGFVALRVVDTQGQQRVAKYLRASEIQVVPQGNKLLLQHGGDPWEFT